jgi:hypothetical protein
LLERIVFAIDAALRRWYSMVEFTSDPTCILRIRVGRLERPLVLANGTCGRRRALRRAAFMERANPRDAQRGRLDRVGAADASLFPHSLQQLVRYLATRPDLADIAVVRCTLMFASPERDAQMARLLGRYGFELVPGASALTLSEHARRFGENIQISLVVLTRNRAALRRDTLRRGRTRMFMSRRALEQRYGGAARVRP